MKDRAEFITNHPGQICCTAVQVVGGSDPFHYSLHYQNIRKQFGSSLSSCARMITVSGYFSNSRCSCMEYVGNRREHHSANCTEFYLEKEPGSGWTRKGMYEQTR
jgi:hypothetical protein